MTKHLASAIGICMLAVAVWTLPSVVQAQSEQISQTGWSLKYVDSWSSGLMQPGQYAFDDEPGTIWQSGSGWPHEIQIDMGAIYEVTGFHFLPRQEGSWGQPHQYEFYVSADGSTWGSAVSTGYLSDVKLEPTTVTFSAKTGRYIRMRLLTPCDFTSSTKTAVAELNVIGYPTSANSPPLVSLTQPRKRQPLEWRYEPCSVTLKAVASPKGASAVTKVQFYHGTTLIGEDTSKPYSCSWSGIAAGTYSLTAKATYADATTSTSPAVSYTVKSSTHGTPMSQTAWSLKYVSSWRWADIGYGGGTAAFDGSPYTGWVTDNNSEPPNDYPHEIQINLGATYTIGGFLFTPVQDHGGWGTPKDYEFYVSSDGNNWGSPVASGTWTYAPDSWGNTFYLQTKTADCTPVAGRYIRMRVLSGYVASSLVMRCAELNVKTTAEIDPTVPPSNLSATAQSSTEILVSWQDNSDNETGFRIKRSTDGVNYATLVEPGPNVTEYADTGLTPETQYYYLVKARGLDGGSDYIGPASDTTPAGSGPAPAIAVDPTNIVVSVQQGQDAADKTFQVWNSGGGTLLYNVLESTTKFSVAPTSESSTGSADKNTHTITFTTASMATGVHSRTISVQDNGSGASNGPITVNVQIQVTQTVPAAPSGLTAETVSATQINLSWTDNSDNEDGFRVRRSLDGVDYYVLDPIVVGPNLTSCVDTGLTPETRYYYKVKATGAGGSDYSNVAHDTTSATSTPTRAYLLLGQSNMSGRGDIEPDPDQVPHPRVLQLSAVNHWLTAIDPLHHHDYPGNVAVGPGLTFGKTVANSNATDVVGLLPCAHGGTAISEWAKGTMLYSNAIGRAAAATNDGVVLMGILWHQGEADSKNTTDANAYQQKLTNLVNDLRADLGAPDLPFICGQLGEWLPAGSYPYAATVNVALSNMPSIVNNTACVSAGGLSHKGDFIHFDAASARELGRRYAAALAALSAPPTPPAAPSGLTATAQSATEISLSWADNSDNEDGFRVRRSLNGSDFYTLDPILVGPDVTSCVDSGLDPATHYYYKVKATGAGVGSDYSNIADDTTHAGGPATLFTAYNDLCWVTGDPDTNITKVSGAPGAETGELVNYADGAATGVRLSVLSSVANTGQGMDPAAGTPAADMFAGIVGCEGLLTASDVTITLDGLNAENRYEITLFGNRGVPAYSGRTSTFTISGAYSFTNTSSPGTTLMTQTLMDDTTEVGTGYNTAAGLLAQFSEVDPGGDGRITFTMATETGGRYVNALRVRALEGPGLPASTAIVGKGASWNYRPGTSELSDPADAWPDPAFVESGWSNGPAPFGYGPLSYGTALSMQGNYVSVFLRKAFTLSDAAAVTHLKLDIDYDDGFIVWLNGRELARVNVAGAPGSEVAYDATCPGYVAANQANWTGIFKGVELPALGSNNVLAAQLFNNTLGSGDAIMDLALSVIRTELTVGEDSDQNRLPDDWETDQLSGPGTDPNGDPDMDGHLNIEEYGAGTDPDSGTSYFAVQAGIADGKVEVQIPTIAAIGPGYTGCTRYYALEERDALSPGNAWQTVPGCNRLLGDGSTIVYNAALDETTKLYRGRVWIEKE